MPDRDDNATEAALRLLEQEVKINQEKLALLKAAIAEGLTSGVVTDGEVVFTKLKQRIKDRAAAIA
jgi:hypothetical protein